MCKSVFTLLDTIESIDPNQIAKFISTRNELLIQLEALANNGD